MVAGTVGGKVGDEFEGFVAGDVCLGKGRISRGGTFLLGGLAVGSNGRLVCQDTEACKPSELLSGFGVEELAVVVASFVLDDVSAYGLEFAKLFV